MCKGAKISSDLNFFYEGVRDAQKTLNDFNEQFTSKIDDVTKKLDSLADFTVGLKVASDAPAAKLVNDEIENWQKIINICRQEAEKQIKGREFQNTFEKVPLIIVFGVVKAGKSTLGNFMHGRAFRSAQFDNVYKNGTLPQTRIIVQEKGREDASEKDAFDENSIESTCSAQYFILPGFAWVDTPGIGAIEKKKEDIQPLAQIAKKYARYADLVVFLSNSANPGIHEDIAGFKELNGKKALIVITRSDTVKSTVKNGRAVKELVPKDAKTRKMQEDHLCDAMARHGVPRSSCDAVSVSTHLAEKGVEEQNDELWEGGNIGAFYRKIVSVISDGKILELKKDAPRKLWNSTIESIVGDSSKTHCLTRLSEDLSHIQVLIQSKYDGLAPGESLVDEIKEDVVNHLRPSIRRHIDHLVDEAESDKIVLNVSGLQNAIQDEYVTVLSSRVKMIVGDFRKDMLGRFSARNIKASAKRSVEVQSFTIQVPDIVERSPEGFFEKIGSFFGRKYHEIEINEEQRSVQIDLGIDSMPAKENIISQLEKALEMQIKEELEKLRNCFFAVTLDKIRKLKVDIDSLSKELLSRRFQSGV